MVTATILDDHITHASGERKTVCVTACLTAIGVPVDGFHYTGRLDDNRRTAILNRHGYAVRSRRSRLPKRATVGTARRAIRKMNDPAGTLYLVQVSGNGYCHALLLDAAGATVVDTAPRKRDKRLVYSIHAVWKR
jgi:hypothetical protein